MTTLSGMDAQLVRAVVWQVLEVTNNLEEALDFLQANLKLRKAGGVADAFAAMLRYACENEGVEFGRVNERLTNPETPMDRAYARMLTHKAMIRQAFHRGGDYLGNVFGAPPKGNGHGRPLHRNITTEHVQLAGQADSGLPFDILNEVAAWEYTLDQTIDLVASATPELRSKWQELRPVLTAGVARDHQDDLHSQLRALARRLIECEVVDDSDLKAALVLRSDKVTFRLRDLEDHPEPLLQNIAVAARDAGRYHYETIQKVLDAFAAAPDIKRHMWDSPEPKVSAPQIPCLRLAHIAPLAKEDRLDLFERTIRADADRRARWVAENLAPRRAEFREALDELVDERRIAEDARDEFLTTFDEYVALAAAFASGQQQELSPRYFECRRQLDFMRRVLEIDSIDWTTKITPQGKKDFARGVDADGDRATTRENSKELVNALMVSDPEVLYDYLREPKREKLDAINLDLAAHMAERIALFEGLGSGMDSDMVLGMDVSKLVARNIFHGYGNKLSTNGRIFLDENVISEEAVSKLLPLGPAFKEALDDDLERHSKSTQLGSFYDRVVEDAWPLLLLKSLTEGKPVETLAYTLSYMEGNEVSEEVVTRTHFAMMMRALENVESKEQMDLYASLLALYFDSNGFGRIGKGAVTAKSPEVYVKLAQLRYRGHFFDRLA
ncbi:hypothetical protein ACFL6C_14665, partial [Myxococcota bacterium]